MSEAAGERRAPPRTFQHSLYPAERIARERTRTVSLCVVGDEAAPPAAQAELDALARAGVVDEIVSLDVGEGSLLALACERAYGELLLVAAGSPREGCERVCCGLLGPLVCEPDVRFVQGFRVRSGAGSSPGEASERVEHLMARPALALFFPELAGVREPMSSELGGERELLAGLDTLPGPAAGLSALLEASRAVGLDSLAQVDLGEHYGFGAGAGGPLAAQAGAALAAVARSANLDGRLRDGPGEPSAERSRSPRGTLGVVADGAAVAARAAV